MGTSPRCTRISSWDSVGQSGCVLTPKHLASRVGSDFAIRAPDPQGLVKSISSSTRAGFAQPVRGRALPAPSRKINACHFKTSLRSAAAERAERRKHWATFRRMSPDTLEELLKKPISDEQRTSLQEYLLLAQRDRKADREEQERRGDFREKAALPFAAATSFFGSWSATLAYAPHRGSRGSSQASDFSGHCFGG